tara:strand:- start:131 stop:247 length:117 start_codon:yes stop_codon:yes gene_type:complete
MTKIEEDEHPVQNTDLFSLHGIPIVPPVTYDYEKQSKT